MNIIFDLDGTLICSKRRLYVLFVELMSDQKLTFDEYWKLKFQGKTNADILVDLFGWQQPEVARFIEDWMQLIESHRLLSLDKPINNIHSILDELKEHNNLYICTARQFEDRTRSQLTELGLIDFFMKILVTQQKQTKENLIRSAVKNLLEEDLIVGDTGKDILVGKALGIKTCAVLSGFMSKEKLVQYCPDMIIKDINHIIKLEG